MTREPESLARRYSRELAEKLAVAQVDWQAVCDRFADNAPALAVLGIHRPVNTRGWVGWIACGHCWQGGGSDQGDLVGWPCETFAAVKVA